LLAPLKATSSAPKAALCNDDAGPPKITLMQALRMKEYRSKIIGCAGSWFLFDVTFYGNALFSPYILAQIFDVPEGSTDTAGTDLQHNLCYQLAILALIGLPGYYVSVWLMDRLGRWFIQMQGFIAIAILYFILALWLNDLPNALMLIIYGLTYFFSNFGPNSTTFILPAEMFPYEVRSTLNGFSAAMGKAGAALGSSCFKLVVDSAGTGVCFGLCAGCALLGALVTFFFIEDRRGLDLAGEDSSDQH